MLFNKAALTALLLSASSASAFSFSGRATTTAGMILLELLLLPTNAAAVPYNIIWYKDSFFFQIIYFLAFVPSQLVQTSRSRAAAAPAAASLHPAGCRCGAHTNFMSGFMLFSEAPAVAATEAAPVVTADTEVPPEVEALDGIANEDEAHNVERPARQSLKKKGPRGKPLSEFKIGDTVKAKVKTLTSYGAFCDIGATTDGLIHISQLAVGFVSEVDKVLQEGQEVEVRIIKIDEGKSQVALSMLTAVQQEAAVEAASNARQSRADNSNSNRGPSGGGGSRDTRPARRDDSAILAKLVEKGWDAEKFIDGKIASTTDFGAFVRVDVSQLNAEVEGEIDGLVHISALSPNRITDVNSFCKVDDKVQVRVKSIADRKVSLTMLSLEDEASKAEARGGGGGGGGGQGQPQVGMGAKDWKESLQRMQGDMPTFTNKPLVVDLRK
jgi:predicted RNA-binding protein with RPS1 domain